VGPRAGLDWYGKSRPTGIRSPDRPARRQSLYRLRYPAHLLPFIRIYFQALCAQYLVFVFYARARVRLCLGCVEWGKKEGEEGQTSNEVDLGRASTANENSVTFQVFASGFKIQKNIFAVSYFRG